MKQSTICASTKKTPIHTGSRIGGKDEKEKYQAHLEAIFRNVKDAIITIDPEMKVIAANDSAVGICGMPAAARRIRPRAWLAQPRTRSLV